MSAWRAIDNGTTPATTQSPKSTGNIGNNTPECGTRMSSSTIPWNLSMASSCQPLLHRSGRASMAEEIKSKFHLLQKRSQPSARLSNWLANKAPSTVRTKNTSSQWENA
eukprot:1775881-Ditylum_brightwellii.AAC.1